MGTQLKKVKGRELQRPSTPVIYDCFLKGRAGRSFHVRESFI